MSMLLSCQALSKTFGARTLFEGVSMGVDEGECLGIIGPNGSGKSTLLKILAGIEQPDAGELTRRTGLRVGYVAQSDAFDPQLTPEQIVTNTLLPEVHDEHEAHIRAAVTLDKVGFVRTDQRVAELSGGWKKRLAIAQQLAREPDLLLLDEPTNHLDLHGVLWLEELIAESNLTTIVVTHDRYFLEEISTRVLELSRAYPQGTFTVEGSYSDFLRRRAEFLDAQAKQEQSLANKVRVDIAWLSRGAKARRTKAKGRIQDSAERAAELAELRRRNAPQKAAAIEFAATGRQTRNLVVAQNISKTMGDKRLFKSLEVTLSPGSCLGLLGPNGSGKSTLIRILTQELAPDTGTIRHADGLRIVSFTQHREDLNLKQTLREALCPVSDTVFYRDKAIHVNTWARRFLFDTQQLKVPVGDLSGGEQARILIANLMIRPADLLILDEPTNDLDIPSLEVLEESLDDFPGAVVLVTHDRFMLDRLSTQVLALDGSGHAAMYPDYTQWQATAERAEIERREKEKAEKAKEAKPQALSETRAANAVTASLSSKKKLSYNEQREWDAMEKNISEGEALVKKLEARMNEPAIVADHRKMGELCKELDAAHATVAKLYERWADLEAKQSG